MDAQEARGERYALEGARVYVHVTYAGNERIVHVDVEHEALARIILPKESTYVGGRDGGVYIGLRPHQAERAEGWVSERVPE